MMYVERLKRYKRSTELRAALTEERARAERRPADKEIAAGKYRGALHGIPYGVERHHRGEGLSHQVGSGAAGTADVRRRTPRRGPAARRGSRARGQAHDGRARVWAISGRAAGRTIRGICRKDRADRQRAPAPPRPRGSSVSRSAPTREAPSSPRPSAAARGLRPTFGPREPSWA